ncbi:MAG: hypothetical protein HQL97_08965 [Magnetococcales bacterium]|nr:hypothetical protein [Magnetococcales bacterium]
MTTAERIHAEVLNLSEDQAKQVLEFIMLPEVLNLSEDQARQVLEIIMRLERSRASESRDGAMDPSQYEIPVLDTRGWGFDRGEANAR